MTTVRWATLVVTVVVGAVFVPAYGEPRQSHDRAGVLGLKAKISEAPFLDKSWTTGWVEKSSGSQVEPEAKLTNRSSFLAEGTGFEPATGFPASDFESCKILSLPFRQPSVGCFSRELLNRIGSCSAGVKHI